MKHLKRFLFFILTSTFLLASCDLPGLGGGQSKNTVKISALATSESQIMAYMLKELIEHDTNGETSGTIINNLGSATIQHNALMNGDADIGPSRVLPDATHFRARWHGQGRPDRQVSHPGSRRR